ncbi:MAG: hypothetical protein FWB86_07105 [Treponema sp.]|nr:hypothetical protein [Treponema sp.]MCL2251992.1 hypothetical protein [Treponema sp.]
MRRKKYFFCFICVIFLFSCTARHFNISLKNTLSVFLLNNGKADYFCIPLQYMGDYQLGKFDFTDGNILIGEYDILLNRDELNIFVYLNEDVDENGNYGKGFNLIYSEEKGKIKLSKMSELSAIKNEENPLNHYYIFIERYLDNNEYKKIINEFEKGNVNSRMRIAYDLIINGEMQNGNGIIDEFELDDGVAMDTDFFPPNLDFFKEKYLQTSSLVKKHQ